MQGHLIINTNEQGKTTSYTQHNMAVWTHVINEILELNPHLCMAQRQDPDPTGQHLSVVRVQWKIKRDDGA